MIIVTTDNLPGYEIVEVLGLTKGSCIKAKHVGKDIGAALKSLVGGELRSYSELMEESREEALSRMIKQAEEMGANAIVGLRFASAQIMSGAAEFIAYGTAVKAQKR